MHHTFYMGFVLAHMPLTVLTEACERTQVHPGPLQKTRVASYGRSPFQHSCGQSQWLNDTYKVYQNYQFVIIFSTGWWYTYPSEIWKSIGMMTFPIIMETWRSCSSHHQPDITIIHHDYPLLTIINHYTHLLTTINIY